MSGINGSCSQSSSLIHTPNPLQQRLNQPQAQHPGATPASPAAPGSGAIQLATALNAPANASANPSANAPASAPASVPEANKGAYIDIHA